MCPVVNYADDVEVPEHNSSADRVAVTERFPLRANKKKITVFVYSKFVI